MQGKQGKTAYFLILELKFFLQAERKRSRAKLSRTELSRADQKIVQLKLWLEPARLGFITSTYVMSIFKVDKTLVP